MSQEHFKGRTLAVVDDLRGRIVRGRYAPGDRLPASRELALDYEVSLPTAQRVLRSLEDNGFVESRGNRGVFVHRHPPHLYHAALVFPWRPGRRSLFWENIRHVADAVARRDPRRVAVFQEGLAPDSNESLDRLNAQLARDEFSGVIFVDYDPWQYPGAKWRRPSVPKVAITTPGGYGPKVPTVYPDVQAFPEAAITLAARRGAQRVAVINYAGSADSTADWVRLARRQGIDCRRTWVLGLIPENPAFVRNAVALLMDRPRRDRPDTLIIADDNLVPAVAQGLLDAGVDRGELSLIAQGNLPLLPPTPLPVSWLAFDIHEMVRIALERIDDQRHGRSVPPSVLLPLKVLD